MFRRISVCLLAVAVAALQALPAAADPPAKTVVVKVKGMACPFCAYGLEKHLKGVGGVSDVEIDLAKSEVMLELKEGSAPGDEQIRQAVREAGLTPGEIRRP